MMNALFAIALLIASANPITVVASNWKFTPNTITLKAGEPQKIHFSSSEGVHGVQSSELGIPMTTIAPGSGVDVTVKPAKPGTYVLPCAVFCGVGHADMKLTIKVLP
jgi:heme/copper-type cytochrome/quinol oxidase subunit 2